MNKEVKNDVNGCSTFTTNELYCLYLSCFVTKELGTTRAKAFLFSE